MKFTDTTIDELKLANGKTEQFFWDDDLPGLGVRLRGKSARWYVRYRINGHQRSDSLGDIRQTTLKAARDAAKQRFAKVQLGIDPAAEKEKKRDEACAERLTFEVVANQYIAFKNGVVKPSTHVRLKHDLLTLFKPFAKRPLTSITRAEIAVRLREIVAEASKRGSARGPSIKKGLAGRGAAQNARRNLCALFGWAMGEGIAESNPVIATNDPGEGLQSRTRVLSDHELGLVWRHCCADSSQSALGLGEDFGKIVKLLILTGCRREEIGGLKWTEIDLETGILKIPGERTKNRHPLTLTLPPAAIDILRSATPRGDRQLVFGNGKTPFDSYTYRLMALRDRISRAEGKAMDHWVPHDLRRTMRTGMGRLGIAPHIAERVINHVKGGVEAIYDKYKYEAEIKTALAVWANHVMSLVDGAASNVTQFRRKT